MRRTEFINKISEETSLSPYEVENVMNAIFANFKTMLDEDEIDAVANSLDSDDLRSVWLTASIPESK